jgi:hypothetical protein
MLNLPVKAAAKALGQQETSDDFTDDLLGDALTSLKRG